ncbi:hypothetical protein EDB84DRAFT_1405589, partial [Lactarius hengduanensis]
MSLSLLYSRNMTSSGEMSKSMWRTTETQMTRYPEVAEKIFQEHYLHPLGDGVGFVRLEQMHRQNRRCDDLIEKTAAALNEDTVALMLLTVQKGNLQLSVKMALNRVLSGAGFKVEGTERMVGECLFAFPFIWVSVGRVLICMTCFIVPDVAQLLAVREWL